jgi:hypothetical protein
MNENPTRDVSKNHSYTSSAETKKNKHIRTCLKLEAYS